MGPGSSPVGWTCRCKPTWWDPNRGSSWGGSGWFIAKSDKPMFYAFLGLLYFLQTCMCIQYHYIYILLLLPCMKIMLYVHANMYVQSKLPRQQLKCIPQHAHNSKTCWINWVSTTDHLPSGGCWPQHPLLYGKPCATRGCSPFETPLRLLLRLLVDMVITCYHISQ
jgi:hypothetical protein